MSERFWSFPFTTSNVQHGWCKVGAQGLDGGGSSITPTLSAIQGLHRPILPCLQASSSPSFDCWHYMKHVCLKGLSRTHFTLRAIWATFFTFSHQVNLDRGTGGQYLKECVFCIRWLPLWWTQHHQDPKPCLVWWLGSRDRGECHRLGQAKHSQTAHHWPQTHCDMLSHLFFHGLKNRASFSPSTSISRVDYFNRRKHTHVNSAIRMLIVISF